MLKFLILTCLIIKTHSWTWYDYPSPRGPDYSKCGVTKPSYVCDPDGMLTDQQREVIVEMVEDFKEKTKRPKSRLECMKEGIRLVVALAKVKIGNETLPSGITNLCTNNRRWTPYFRRKCESDVHGIELNLDSGFRYCAHVRYLMLLPNEDYEMLNKSEEFNLEDKNYFDALKRYIDTTRMLYIHRSSIFDNPDVSKEHASLRLLGIISIIISLIIGLVLLFLICQIRQIKNYLNQRNTSKTETQLMTPLHPVEVVEKRREDEENEEATKPLLNL